MRPQFVSLLLCPLCKSDLALHGFRAGAPPTDCVEQGLLICRGCFLPYPVVDGIPRMLPNSFQRWGQFRREFARQLANLSFRKHSSYQTGSFERLHSLTARAFGYEWNTYKTTSQEEDILTFYWLTGVDPDLYNKLSIADVFTYYPTATEVAAISPASITGLRILDVGCGMGKYVKVCSENAAEVIGIDLSDSLQRARQETCDRSNVDFVQGDILNPPLRRQSMDLVYSVGVLHHTPDCHQAFLRCASLVAPGGVLAVWLYPADLTPGKYANWVHWLQDDFLRPITCRMPLWALRVICAGLGRLTFIRDRYAERYRMTGSRLAMRIAMAAGAIAVGRHHDPEIAAFLNFDWYSPHYRSYHSEQQLQSWFQEVGFGDVQILPQKVSGIGRRFS